MLQQDIARDGGQSGGPAFELFAHSGKHQAQIVVPDGGGDCFPAAPRLLEQVPLGKLHAVRQIVETLLTLADEFDHAGEGAVLREFSEGLASHEQPVAHRSREAFVQRGGMIFDFLTRADHELGGRGWSGGSQVGNEIDDGEIGFVPHCGDERNGGRSHGSRQIFIIEGREVFGGAAAARDDNYVHIFLLVKVANAGGYFMRGGISLNLRGINQEVDGAVTALDDVENVAQGRGLRRGDDSDASGKGRNRLLAFGGEQALGFKFCLQLFEGQLQRARAFGLDVLGRNLQFATIFINGDAPSHNHLQAVGGAETQQASGGTEHDHSDLGVAVFQGEVEVSGVGGAKVGNFSYDPGVGIFTLDVSTDSGDQVADLPDATVRRAESEAHLVG